MKLILYGEMTPAAEFGLREIEKAMRERGIVLERCDEPDDGSELAVGTTKNEHIRHLSERAGCTMEDRPEGIILGRISGSSADPAGWTAVCAGTDARGLMYALCELASRIRANGFDALEKLVAEVEFPAIRIRACGRFIMSERDDTWYFSENFWKYYAARLAKCRINRLQLITGFDTAYLSPPYPFLVKTPGYESVLGLVVNGSPELRRERCLNMLWSIGQTLHAHGVDFCLGIWQQKPWTANQQYRVADSPPDEKFADYAQKSIAELLRQCPQIDVLSFRVNMEAGLRKSAKDGATDTAEDFWLGMIDAIAGCGRRVGLDLRAKGLTDRMIAHAVAAGLDVTVPTKAWCEHIGLPYPMPQLRQEELRTKGNLNGSRRYSYDDLQHQPRDYDIQYRLWNYGSTNLLLWGAPDYVARFIRGCLVAQAVGFEFTAPLSLKGGHTAIPGEDWQVRSDTAGERFEDERYFMWYLAYGRLSYNPDASPEIWRRELRARFGNVWQDAETAYRVSGWILPLITAAHFPEHPSLHYWPELYSGAALFAKNNDEPYFIQPKSPQKKDNTYATALPSDEALFCSIERYVEGELAGYTPECVSPLEVADWYHTMATATQSAAARLGEEEDALSSASDFQMIANIGIFHAWTVHAAYYLCKFEKTRDCGQLAPAYASFVNARAAWAALSELGDRHYARNLEFDAGTSTRRNGNWRDRLERQVDADLSDLAALLTAYDVALPPPAERYVSLTPRTPLPVNFTDDVPESSVAGEDLTMRLTPGFLPALDPECPIALYYRRFTMRDGVFKRLEMRLEGNSFEATIPGEEITADYNLMIYFVARDAARNAVVYPGIFGAERGTPYYVVRVKERAVSSDD